MQIFKQTSAALHIVGSEGVKSRRFDLMNACERPRIGMTMKDDDHVLQWKHSLPTSEELTPLSKSLLSPAFQSVFSRKPEPPKKAADVSRDSRASFLELRSQSQRSGVPSFDPFPLFKERRDTGSYGHSVEPRSDGEGREGDRRGKCFPNFAVEGRADARVDFRRDTREAEEPEVGLGLGIGSGGSGGGSDRGGVAEKQGHGGHPMATLFRAGSDPTGYNPSEGRPEHGSGGLPFMMNGLPYAGFDRRPESSSYSGRGDEKGGGSSSKNARKLADSDFEDTDSGGGPVNSNEEPNARTLKRPRLVWTPQLHKRFVDAVGHLGIKNAVPKTIMQLMNVEGLTRENVASHLQKYRLYLKRLQGLSSDGPPASADQLFASTPLPPNLGLQYMPSQREDVGPQSFPSGGVAMPFQGLGGRGPLSPAHFSAYEPIAYGGMSRGFMERPPMKDRTEHISESENQNQQNHHGAILHSLSQNQASSPPKRLLSLFPTTSE